MTSRPLWRDRDFAAFWGVQTLSELGNSFAYVALPLLVLRATGSVAQMGALTAVAAVASMGTGLFAGLLADRLDRRLLLMLCDGARMVLYGLIPIVWAFTPQVWILYVVMAVTSVFEMIFKVGYVAAVPNLVEPGRVIEANSLMETTNAIAYVAGPALAGLVSGLFGPTAAITANAVSFGVSVLGLAAIRLRAREGQTSTPGLREGLLVGAAFIWRTPVLRSLTLLLTVVTFLSLGMTDVIIYYVRHGLGEGDRTVGYVLAVGGGGTCVAAYLTATLRRSLGFGMCWLGSYVLCGVALALAALSHGVALVAVAVFGYSFGMALAGISSMSLRQQVTPDALLGRTTAAFWTLHGALAPLGATVLTALVQHVGIRGPLLAAGLVFLTVVAIGALTPIRQREPKGPRAEPVQQAEGGGSGLA